MKYEEFLASKRVVVPEVGFDAAVPDFLYPFQRRIVSDALRRGRAAIFAECGLGKTPMQLAWADACAKHTGKPGLILAPLAVAKQTVREAVKFGMELTYAERQQPGRLLITNYERLDNFDPAAFGSVVLDESSILKAYSGATKRKILDAFAATLYRLACSATPAPNDHLELGNHSEFLSVMSSHQMIARWFINDTSLFGSYRLKGHAVEPFWDWVSSWAAMAQLPSDMGEFSDDGYVLPDLRLHSHVVDVDVTADRGEQLFRTPELSATSVHQERRRSAPARAKAIAELVLSEPHESWLLWTETDYEADAVMELLGPHGAREARGSDAQKEDALDSFTTGALRVLVTKPKIAGLGLNWQHCSRMVFCAATFSFESWYQAIRRCWRFGQARPVDVHMVMGSTERAVLDVLHRKRDEFASMRDNMMAAARRSQHARDKGGAYVARRRMKVPTWLRSEERT